MPTARRQCFLLICAVVLTSIGSAAADGPAAAVAPAAPSSPASPPAAAESPGENARPSLGLIMENNGGSLMRAESSLHPAAGAEEAGAGDGKPDAPPGSFNAISFFAVSDAKPKTYKKHDLVTIIARENSAFTATGDSKLSKAQDYDTQLNAFINLRPSKEILNSVISGATNVPEIKFQNARDFSGTGAIDRTDTFSDRVTAEVVDVKPNGTLVLQAIKQIKTDEEVQRMILTGTCRAADVAADNTVLTTQLFDLELQQTHTGAVNDTTTRGLIPRLLDKFSPF